MASSISNAIDWNMNQIAHLVAKAAIKDMRSRIKKQQSVTDAAYRPLAASTLKQKKYKGYKNPHIRMVATGDFLRNAHVWDSDKEKVKISLSDKVVNKYGTTYRDIGKYNQDNRSYHFGLSKDAHKRIMGANGIIDRYISNELKKFMNGMEKGLKNAG